MNTLRILLLVPLTLCLAHAATPPASAEAKEPGTRAEVDDAAPELQGVIVILMDTVRSDRLSAYGHRRPTSPALARLAERGVLFEEAISYAPWTLPSVAAFLAGDRFSRAYDRQTNKLRRSVVEAIQGAGFRTAAITESGFVSAHFDFDRGFDQFREERSAVFLRSDPDEAAPPAGVGNVHATFRLGRRWLREHRKERFFLLLHTYEPHTPYMRRFFTKGIAHGKLDKLFYDKTFDAVRSGELVVGDTERRYAAALYDGGLREVDRELATLMGFVNQIGLGDRTLFVVTSDHGEDLGEHYPDRLGDHGHALHDEQLRVPLVIADPTRVYPVSRVAAQVRTIDVLPTVADLLGVPLPAEIEGRSLVPLMRGDETASRIAFGGATKVSPNRFFVRHEGYKYIESAPGPGAQELSPAPPLRQLYDLDKDPGEQHNLALEKPELAKRFHDLIADYLGTRGTVPRGGMSVETEIEKVPEAQRDQLRALGYVE